ncbi:MAG TPA: ribbon-helix-helix domain-containing protein [Rhodopila sp.]|jgi:predicted DNA-binding ribbon-helix-helix protein|nr:ribbon-helix-helix domain-containing protein [Rhodopila sp.]
MEHESAVQKRSISLGGRKTSISLEEQFWLALKEIASDRDVPVRSLVAQIDTGRDRTNLSSALRVYVLEHYKRLRALEDD